MSRSSSARRADAGPSIGGGLRLEATRTDGDAAPTTSAQWEILAVLFDATAPSPRSIHDHLVHIVIAIAFAKAILTGIAVVAGAPIVATTASVPAVAYGCLTLGFVLPGILLLVTPRQQDRRAGYLGGFFLITGLAFARHAGRVLAADLGGALWAPVRWVAVQDLDPFLPVLLWLFAREFPQQPLGRRAGAVVPAVLAVAWFTASALSLLQFLHVAQLGSVPAAFGVIGRSNTYWLVTFGLTLGALGFMLVRSRNARGSERRRVRWFCYSLVLGCTPLFLEVVLEAASRSIERWAQSPAVRPVLGTALFACFATIPISTMYAVLRKRVLDVRVVVRRALQCAAAKYGFVAASVAPLAYLGWRFYTHADGTVAELVASPSSRLLVVCAAAGLVGLGFAERVLRSLDGLFFGPRYDPREVTARVRGRLWRAADGRAVADILKCEIREALDPVEVGVMVGVGGQFVDPDRDQALPRDSPLVDTLARSRSSYVTVTDQLLRSVTVGDARWLAAVGAEWIVPIRARDGAVVGFISLSEQRRERPYFREDYDLLVDLAAAAALTLERYEGSATDLIPVHVAASKAAGECPACGRVAALADTSRCPACRHSLEQSQLPAVVHGKFHLRRRLGRGGMGVVYLADDIVLRRAVALKTLPYTSALAEQRTRCEARAMACVTHPNLASIYGFELCERRPILVMEYLPNGTLAAYLVAREPSAEQVVDWGVALCDGLACLHQQGLLHGDVKPSNIGFDLAWVPKLLDFGLAAGISDDSTITNVARAQWGTPSYQCPDSAEGRLASPQSDLWSLAAVLYEALARRRVADLLGTRGRRGVVPDLRTFRPDVPVELAAFFHRALHSRMELRPVSAGEFSLWLHQARPIH